MIIVDEELRVTVSRQITSVPFVTLMFAGLITSLVISGRVFTGEILEKMNKTDLTVRFTGAWLGLLLRNRLPYLTVVISPSGIPKTLHSTWFPVTLQINSSGSPLHAGTIPLEDIVAEPARIKFYVPSSRLTVITTHTYRLRAYSHPVDRVEYLASETLTLPWAAAWAPTTY